MLHLPAISLANTRPFALRALQFSVDLNGPHSLHSDNHTQCGTITSVPSQRTYTRKRSPAVFVNLLTAPSSRVVGRPAVNLPSCLCSLSSPFEDVSIQEKYQHHEQGFEIDSRISIGKVILTDLDPRAQGLSPQVAKRLSPINTRKTSLSRDPRNRGPAIT